MGYKCTRCGFESGPLDGTLCDLCRMDVDILEVVSDWCTSEGSRDILQWQGESLTETLEYEIFMLIIQKLGENLRPGALRANS